MLTKWLQQLQTSHLHRAMSKGQKSKHSFLAFFFFKTKKNFPEASIRHSLISYCPELRHTSIPKSIPGEKNETTIPFSFFINLLFLKIFIYLAVTGPSCSTRDLFCSMQDLQFWHAGSSSPTRDGTRGPRVGSAESQPLEGGVFFNSKCFRWREGNRKNPQSLPCYSFLCKTGLADTTYSRW